MRRFQLYRDEDVSGVSGTGVVALGVVFPDGVCAMHWLGLLNSTVIYARLEHILQIHGHGGRTRIVYLDKIGSTAEAAAALAQFGEDQDAMDRSAPQTSG